MAEIGVRSGKVRAGFYRCGAHCIHKGSIAWGVFLRDALVYRAPTLTDAYNWSRRNQPQAS